MTKQKLKRKKKKTTKKNQKNMDKEELKKIFLGEIQNNVTYLEQLQEFATLDQEKKQELRKKLLAGLLNIMQYKIPNKLIINESNKKILLILLAYFTGDFEMIEKYNIDKNKGLYLCGDYGTGKTLIFSALYDFTSFVGINKFKFYSSIDIITETSKNGVETIEKFQKNFSEGKTNAFHCYIDDIASVNEKINHFGNQYNIMELLILSRYEAYTKYRKLTFFSSNLYPKQLKQTYNERIIERLREMCNIIELTGKTLRK